MARIIYSFLLYLLSPWIVLYLYFLRGGKNPGYRKHMGERFGFGAPKADLVIHCASVGEVMAATPVIKTLRLAHPELNILVTCNTPTGRERIRAAFADQVDVRYLPLDLPCAANRFLRSASPNVLCVLETELWPNLLISAKKKGIATLVINARLSKKSLRGYLKAGSLSRALVSSLDHIACHHGMDARRFELLGAKKENLTVTGSIKFDLRLNDEQRQKANALRDELGRNRPVWIAGSTHSGEHEQVLAAHKKLLKTIPTALLILVPRHPEQFTRTAELIEAEELEYSRRSEGFAELSQVLLGDTMGELSLLYGAADIAFIGGSLIERGGHNPLEASAFSIPVLTGPSYYNFAHVYPTLLGEEGAEVVENGQQLASRLRALFTQPDRAKRMGQRGALVVKANQGAVAKSCELIERLMNSEKHSG